MALILSGDTGPSFVQSAAMPTGSVLQVVNASSSTRVSTSSSGGSVVTTGFSASITPSSSTNKILIICSLEAFNSSSSAGVNFTVYRNSTNLSTTGQPYLSRMYPTNANAAINVPIVFLDSPATTSATTYTVYYSTAGGGTAYLNQDEFPSTIVLQEIKA